MRVMLKELYSADKELLMKVIEMDQRPLTGDVLRLRVGEAYVRFVVDRLEWSEGEDGACSLRVGIIKLRDFPGEDW